MTQTNLLNHLWQSTLFAAAAGLLTLALRKNRAPVRYWLWFAASVKFLIPFSLLVTIGSQFEWRAAPAAAPAQFFSVVNEISQPIALPAQLPRPAKEPEAPTVLLGLWLCGVSVVAYAWARQWLRVRAALRVASPLHLTLPIRAMSSPARLEPGVFGVFRPVLLLPEGITDRLTPSQWNAILAHELCHVRRRDNLTAAIHMAVEAIFWFHPLVWWIGKRLVDERERTCDEEVLLAAGDPQDYAEGILNVCKLYVESPLACVSGVTGSNLKNRIRAIMTERVAGDLNFAKKLVLTAAGMAALAAPIGVGILHAPRLLAQSRARSPAPQIVAQPAVSQPAVPQQRLAPQILAQNQPRPAPETPKPLPDLPDLAPVDDAYVIGPTDVLYISVLRDKDYTGIYPVHPDGIITIPLVGEIKADGLTRRQLAKQLTEALSQFMKDPEVSVTPYDVRSKKYTVTGQVKRPGPYPLTPPITVFEAINDAGGFADGFSNQKDILILRGGETFHFNYRTYIRGENRDQDITLQNGDTIVVK